MLWTALFFACFMVGRNIPILLLHGTGTGAGAAGSGLLNAANTATGGNFFSPSVFSPGLGPLFETAIIELANNVVEYVGPRVR